MTYSKGSIRNLKLNLFQVDNDFINLVPHLDDLVGIEIRHILLPLAILRKFIHFYFVLVGRTSQIFIGK